jgi:hypothetical protein
MGNLSQLISNIGPLRFMLQVLTLIFVFLSLSVGDTIYYSGWRILTTLVVPALIPIIFFGILLELLMSTVFMVDAEEPDKKARFKTIIKIDLLLVAGLLSFWVPTMLRLLN